MSIISLPRRITVKIRTQAMNQIRALLISAPDEIRARLWNSNSAECANGCSRLRLLGKSRRLNALTSTVRLLAKRWLYLTADLQLLYKDRRYLTSSSASGPRDQFGVGPQTASILLSLAGDNPQRLRNEAALASLFCVNPPEESQGKTIRHRLNRGGNRTATKLLKTGQLKYFLIV